MPLSVRATAPRGLGLILFIELWERFSYYGMRSLLTLYMVCQLGLSTAHAGQIYGLYTGLAYLLPVAGGLLADRVIGERRAILVGGTLMAAGHFTMVIPGWTPFVCALGLLVLGTGLFKANTAALLGRLYDDGRPGREGAFAWFYLTVNLGGFLAPLVCGTLAGRGHWHRGFGAAGVGMCLGLAAWITFEHRFGDAGAPPRKAADPGAARKRLPPLTPTEKDRLKGLAIVAMVGNIGLWAAVGQAGSSLALFAERATRRSLPFTQWELPSSSLQAVNPLFILLGVPALGLLERALGKRGRRPSPPVQMAVGMLLVSCAFMVLAWAGWASDGGDKVSIVWLLVAILLNTLGELCISPLGLSLVSRLAPARYSSAMMGLWYASMAIANGISGQFGGLYDAVPKAKLFLMPVLWTAAAAIAFFALRGTLQRLLRADEA